MIVRVEPVGFKTSATGKEAQQNSAPQKDEVRYAYNLIGEGGFDL